MNGVNKLIDILKTAMNRGVTQIGDFIDPPQFLQDLGPDCRGRDFASARLELVHNFVYSRFKRHKADRAFFACFGHTVDELASVERLMCSVAFDNAEITSLDLLVCREAIGTL